MNQFSKLSVDHLTVGNRPPAKFPVPLPPSPSMKDDEVKQIPYLDFCDLFSEAVSSPVI